MSETELLRWFEYTTALPPELANERERILAEIRTLYEKSGGKKERYR